LRILEIADRSRFSGPDAVAKAIAKRLPKDKFEVFFSGDFGNNRVTKLFKLLGKVFDVVRTRCWFECVILLKLIRYNRHIFSSHGYPEKKELIKAENKLVKKADLVHCVSKFVANGIRERYGIEPIVIYNGVDTDEFCPIEHHNERLKIMFCGRPIKGLSIVLKLAKLHPECDFELYGAGVSEYCSNHGISCSNCNIHKFVSRNELVRAYQNSDIFLFPSINEPFGLVVLEAMASGLPVVCYRSGGIPEFVEHQKHGLLATNFADMADHLDYLIEDENVIQKMLVKERFNSIGIELSLNTPKCTGRCCHKLFKTADTWTLHLQILEMAQKSLQTSSQTGEREQLPTLDGNWNV